MNILICFHPKIILVFFFAILIIRSLGEQPNESSGNRILKIIDRRDAKSIQQLSEILNRAAEEEQPSEELLDWLQAQDKPGLMMAITLLNTRKVFPRERRMILQRSVDFDPDLTLKMAPELVSFKAWVVKFPVAAMEWLSHELEMHPKKFGNDEKIQMLESAAYIISKNDPLLAMNLMSSFGALGESAMLEKCNDPIISHGFDYTMTFIKKCNSKSVISKLFDNLGERFPVLASDWVSSEDDYAPYIYEVAVGRMRIKCNPEGAVNWLSKLPEEKALGPINRLFELYPIPEPMVKWLFTMTDVGWLDQARLDCALYLVEDDAPRALDLALQIKKVSRWWIYQHVIKCWRNKDKTAADNWLSKNSARIPIPTDEEKSYYYTDGR